jgi:GNAT superfamily N-acetyltransferase
MIYSATKADLPKILECSLEYTQAMPNNVKLNPDHLISSWERLLDLGIGVIYLAEENGEVIGGIGGVRHAELFTGNMTAVEMFWYMKEGKRGTGIKLFKMFEQWAKDNQCARVAMIYLPFSMPEKLDRFYTKNGYTLLEMHYEKELI